MELIVFKITYPYLEIDVMEGYEHLFRNLGISKIDGRTIYATPSEIQQRVFKIRKLLGLNVDYIETIEEFMDKNRDKLQLITTNL